jgi:hypothetical protein
MYILFPYFGYRNHHEFIIEAIRFRIEKLIGKQHQLEKLRKNKTYDKSEDEKSD